MSEPRISTIRLTAVRDGHRNITEFYPPRDHQQTLLDLARSYAAGARLAGFDCKIVTERTTEEEG